MANKNKLYITISDERGGDGPTPTPQPGGAKEKDSNALGRYVEHQMFHLVKRQATQAVNFAISNIGNFTGDYIAQRKVNVAKQAISGVMQVGEATLAGAGVGGWVGAIVGFVLGGLSLVADSVYGEMQNQTNNAITNLEIAQLRDRAGLNTVYDGSRGTEN